jgi:hypothetical protein
MQSGAVVRYPEITSYSKCVLARPCAALNTLPGVTRFRPIRTALVAFALTAGASTAHAFTYDFTDSAQGWTSSGTSAFSWVSVLGNPGGHIALVDSASRSAPVMTAIRSFADPFNAAGFYGGTLSFDFRYLSPGVVRLTNHDAGKVKLSNGTRSISADFFNDVDVDSSLGGAWQTFSLPLNFETFGMDNAATMRSFLGELTKIQIIVDPRMSGPLSTLEVVGLDNITVTPVPEPHEWAMMLAGLGLVGWVARRNKRTAGAPSLAAT